MRKGQMNNIVGYYYIIITNILLYWSHGVLNIGVLVNKKGLFPFTFLMNPSILLHDCVLPNMKDIRKGQMYLPLESQSPQLALC